MGSKTDEAQSDSGREFLWKLETDSWWSGVGITFSLDLPQRKVKVQCLIWNRLTMKRFVKLRNHW